MNATDKQSLIVLAKKIAAKFQLDGSLVCAVVEQESGWNPWSMRYEPLFFTKYVAGLYTSNKIGATEAYARGISWGLMQVMGQVAREEGVTLKYLSGLCDPEAGLSIGCAVLAKKLERAGGDVNLALQGYNGGGNTNYDVEVLGRQEKYK